MKDGREAGAAAPLAAGNREAEEGMKTKKMEGRRETTGLRLERQRGRESVRNEEGEGPKF